MEKSGILKTLKNMAAISLIFSCVIFSLITVNYIQYRTNDPLNSQALTELRERFKDDQENGSLIGQIRSMDLLTRKAFFTAQWQIETGKYLLLAGIIVFFASINIYSIVGRKIRKVQSETAEDDIVKFRFLLSSSGIVFLVAGMFFSVLTYNDFNNEKLFVDSLGSLKPSIKPPLLDDIKNNWQVFRGTSLLGAGYEGSCPDKWNVATGENIIWKSSVPKNGKSSPVIWNDMIFLTGGDEKSREVYCYDFLSGNLSWKYTLSDNVDLKKMEVAEDNGYATPTMATNGIYVFAAFPTGFIVALDFSGKLIWSYNFGIPDNHYGYASSLAIYENILLFQNDQSESGYVAGINALNGKIVWKTKRDVSASWASPLLILNDKTYQLILSASPYLTSYDPVTGKELWKIECLSGEIGSSPSYSDGIVFAANKFSQLSAVDLASKKIIWYYEDNLPDASSPAVANGLLILPTPNGVVSCLDAKTGKVIWENKFETGFYSSPVICGNKVFLIDRTGICRIFKFDRSFERINDIDMKEKVVATPAFYKNSLVVRTEKNLYAIGKK